MRYRYWISVGASLLLAVIFITAGIGKLVGQNAFLLSVSTSVLNQQAADFISALLPWGELLLGALLAAFIMPQIVAGVSALLIGAFIFHNSWMIANGMGYHPCGCLGVFDKVFQGKLSTTGSLYIDIGMLVLALFIYFGYPGKLIEFRPWFLRWRKKAPPLVDAGASTPPSNGGGGNPTV
jgi:uncharacterized membrane protein YphA (DoxX/SURF4 family)